MRGGLRIGRSGPAIVVCDERIPLRDRQADDDENSDEPKPGELDENQKMKPPPSFSPAVEIWGRAEAAFIFDGEVIGRDEIGAGRS